MFNTDPLPWFVLPVEGSDMERYNPIAFLTLGRRLQAVFSLPNEPDFTQLENVLVIAFMGVHCESLQKGKIQFSRGTVRAAKEAYDLCETVGGFRDQPQDTAKLGDLKKSLETLEERLKSDCESLNLFHVRKVLAYDTATLVENGEWLIDDPLRPHLSDLAMGDLRDAARCLAFEAPTAAVFHVARATEDVMRLYHRWFVGPLPSKDQQKTIGGLLGEWRKPGSGADPIIMSDIEHIKNHYRDRVGHPESRFTVSEARRILPSCVGVMTSMIEKIDKTPDPPKDATVSPKPV